MEDFQSLNLPEALLHKLKHLNFNTPTPIQTKSIPFALQGKDILGSAQTGTGKTGAFGIPLIAKLLKEPESAALVITPTRELAVQVHAALTSMLAKSTNVKAALLIGGENIERQIRQLKQKPRLFVGTPGRLNDHLRNRHINLKNVNYLVLDETDRMLDMGFSIQIDDIMKHLPDERQTLLFSATLPSNIVSLTKKYLKDPERISVGSTVSPAKNVEQTNLFIPDNEKYDTLLTQLNDRKGSIIVFVKTKFGAEKMAKKLYKAGHKADAIHGDLRHNKRERVTKAFRSEKFRILVATDVAARGLDIPHIKHVINYDLPQCPEDYIHRIGRTARAGSSGEALNLIGGADKRLWNAIDILMNPEKNKGQKDRNENNSNNSRSRNRKPFNKKSGFSRNSSKSNSAKKDSFSTTSRSKKTSDRNTTNTRNVTNSRGKKPFGKPRAKAS